MAKYYATYTESLTATRNYVNRNSSCVLRASINYKNYDVNKFRRLSVSFT